MLNAIVRFSIRFRGIVISLACALLFYGIFSLSHVPYDVFPEFAPPEVSIQTEAPGLSPEQVEVLVTQPIENAINGVVGIESLRSRSIQGLSVISVVFRPGTDIYRDRQAVTERLSTVTSELPTGVQPPLMTPLTSSTTWVMEVGLTSDTQSLMTLRTIADWTVKRRLLAVSGVAAVEVVGGEVRQIQFQFDPQRLVQYGLSVEDVIGAARQATGVRGAGFVDTPNQRIVLQTEGQSLTAAQLARTVLVHHNGANVLLGDVARVADAPAPAIGAATIRGKPGVILIVDAAYGSNTLEVTHGIDKAVADLRMSLEAQGISAHPDVFRAADFIDIAIHNVRDSLLIGAVLVILVLFLFLFNLRTAAISCTAIPLSLLAAVIALDKMGLSLNTMTLGGLSIAIGEVVDDAVIDVSSSARESSIAKSSVFISGRVGCLDRGAERRRLCDIRSDPGFLPGSEYVRFGRKDLRSPRHRLHLGNPRLTCCCPDRYTRSLHRPTGRARSPTARTACCSSVETRISRASSPTREGTTASDGSCCFSCGTRDWHSVSVERVVPARVARGKHHRTYDSASRNIPAAISPTRESHHGGPTENSFRAIRGATSGKSRTGDRYHGHASE